MEYRVLILAPFGRDARVITDVLAPENRTCFVCADLHELATELDRGAGLAIMTEESLRHDNGAAIAQWLQKQAAWSDLPVVLLSGKLSSGRSAASIDMLERLGNVLVLERPLNSETLRRAVASALRARTRQYDARRHLAESQEHLIERAQAQEALEKLNASLESRIEERTQELASANNRLMKEIHERAKVQAVLVQSQKMEALGQLTGGIAHDFNNLLNIIMANAELLSRISDDERVRRMAATTKRATERGAKLTAQLLTFSRTSNLDLKAINVAPLLDGMRDIISISLGSHIDLSTTSSSRHLWTKADANQLELAVLNLAINARDAMPGGGRLSIHADERTSDDAALPAGRYVVVSVSDSGSGIEPNVLSRVFDPFFTTKPIGKGTGLGLSQVYGIARQAGGEARIESEPGKGTTVQIWLPVNVSDIAESSVEAASPDVPLLARHILVIEDDEEVRAMLVECLEVLGYKVTHAHDGASGLSRLDTDKPDLLIVDYAMPGLNGVQVLMRVRDIRPDIPVILATGYADVDIAKITATHFTALRKPFQLDELARTVRAALKAH
jgi:signal transduction histidine kinase